MSAGNFAELCLSEDGYRRIPPNHQSAKNVITVGALNANETALIDVSSKGPTEDGRIAPTFALVGEIETDICRDVDEDEITDEGTCIRKGTSYAAPKLGGFASQLLSAYRVSHNDETATLSSADMRALFAATATDFGRPGPDYEYGFGIPDVTRAIDALLGDYNLYRSAMDGENEDHYDTTIHFHDTTVHVHDTAESFTVVLSWDDLRSQKWRNNDDADPVLTNDLELRVIAPDGTIHCPFILNPIVPTETATTGADNVNTIEQVVIDNPQTGNWTISVRSNGRIVRDYNDNEPSQKYTVVHVTTPPNLSIPLTITLSSSFTTTSFNTSLIVVLVVLLISLTGFDWMRASSQLNRDS